MGLGKSGGEVEFQMRIEPAIAVYIDVRRKKHGIGHGSRLRAFKLALAMFCCSNGITPWHARLAWWLAIYGTSRLPPANKR